MVRLRYFLGVGLVLLLIAGCAEGETGDEGKVLVNFATDASVSHVTLTGVGINVVASIPDPARYYRSEGFDGRVDWRAGGTDYTAFVNIEGLRGSHGKKGLLPPGVLPCGSCPPLVGEKGEDGDDHRHTLLFAGAQAYHFRKIREVTGQ